MTSKELRSNPSKLWESGTGEETVITVNGKPKAIVIEAENGDIEEQLKSIRRAKAGSALDKLRTYSVKCGLNKLTDKDIFTEVKKARNRKDSV